MNWNNFTDIHDVEAINENDYDCLEEVRDVLKKYGKQDRFGVTLIHKHFDLETDEVMMEYTDVESRVQTLKPIKKELVKGNSIETSWILGDGDRSAMTTCNTQCWKDIHGNHNTNHV